MSIESVIDEEIAKVVRSDTPEGRAAAAEWKKQLMSEYGGGGTASAGLKLIHLDPDHFMGDD